MIRVTAAAILPIALLTGCATPRPAAAPPGAPMAEHALVQPAMPGLNAAVAGTVYIYRGMPADAQTGKINWDQANFGISGGTLSFGSVADNSRPCWIKLTVAAPAVPVPVNDGGTIAVTLPNGVQQPAAASPWPAVFDDNPAGHWSMTRATLGPSNSKAQANAALVFKYNADNQPAIVSVVNGALQNCQK